MSRVTRILSDRRSIYEGGSDKIIKLGLNGVLHTLRVIGNGYSLVAFTKECVITEYSVSDLYHKDLQEINRLNIDLSISPLTLHFTNITDRDREIYYELDYVSLSMQHKKYFDNFLLR